MRKILLVLAAISLSVPACTPATVGTGPVASLPGAGAVCSRLNDLGTFDKVVSAYIALTDAIDLLINVKVITPGSATAKTIASANDKVLAALNTAEAARKACNADSYLAAMAQAGAGIAEIRAVLPKR